MPMQATTTTPLFSAALKPDRSLGLAGGWVAYAVAAAAATPLAVLVSGVLLPAAAALALAGAGLTILSIRQARHKRVTQTVTLWPDQLEVSSESHGARTLRRFDPKSVRLVLERDDFERTVAMRLRSGQDEIELGAFLKAEDRASFARAFGTALRRARMAA